MTPPERIGIAMVGCGQIAEAHLKAVAAVEGAALTFAVDADAGREPPASGREVVKVMRVLDLVRQASETGQAMHF